MHKEKTLYLLISVTILYDTVLYPSADQPESLAFPSKAFLSASTAWANSYSPIENGPLYHVTYNKLADGSKYGFLLLSYYLRGNLNDIERLLDIWKKVNKVC